MEEAIRILTERKIRELLGLFGIQDESRELPLQHINGISDFGELTI